jgi:hypothetical protein
LAEAVNILDEVFWNGGMLTTAKKLEAAATQ